MSKRVPPSKSVAVQMSAAAPATIWSVIAGNPVMWALMAVALSTRWRWVSAFVLMKPFVFLDHAVFGSGERRMAAGGGWDPHSRIAAVTVVADGCRAVELKPGDGARALDEMRAAGAVIR